MNNITLGMGKTTGYKMARVKTSLKLFGGDTVVVRCSERCRIHLMSTKGQKQSQADILTVRDDKAADGAWHLMC